MGSSPFVISGLLICERNKIFGIPDIIIKSSLLNRLFHYPNNEPININSKYTIIDVKNSNIEMNADGITMRNTENGKCYKAQLSIYNYLLNTNLNKNKNTAVFILARQYGNIINDDSSNYKLAKIDLADRDNFYDYKNQKYDKLYKYFYNKKRQLVPKKLLLGYIKNKYKNKIDCNIRMNKNHYPNMKVNTLTTNTKVKKVHSKILNELTSLWGIDLKTRELLHKEKVYSWDKLNKSHIDKYVSEKKRTIVNNIISINKDKSNKIIKWDRPDKIALLDSILYPSDEIYDIYLDFETITDAKYKNEVFLIGCYNPLTDKYFKFVKEDLSDDNLLIEFFNSLNCMLEENNYGTIRLYYWSSFEKSIINKQYEGIIDSRIEFIDLLEIFKDAPNYKYPITIKDAFNFSIKSIGKGLHTNGLLDIYWKDDIANGLEAMEQGIQYYSDKKPEIMDKIIEYNIVDCKIMHRIMLSLYTNFN